MTEIRIHTPFIKLDALLKFAGLVETGGEGKIVILEGLVSVNGQVCTQRGRKIVPGDRVDFEGNTLAVVAGQGDRP